MRQWIEDILVLQKTDLRIRALKTKTEMIPVEAGKLKDEIVESKNSLEKEKRTFQKSELSIKQLESEIEKEKGEIEKLQKQSVLVKKNDEYRALMNEIDFHNKKISDFETKEIEVWDIFEESKKEFKKYDKEFNIKEKSIKNEIIDLLELKKDIASEIEKMKEKRSKESDAVDKSILSKYDRLLLRGKGNPVVSLINETNCGNCHLKLLPQTLTDTRNKDVVNCENCGHFLYEA